MNSVFVLSSTKKPLTPCRPVSRQAVAASGARGGYRYADCDAEGVPLEVEHVIARSRGSSNRPLSVHHDLPSAMVPSDIEKRSCRLGLISVQLMLDALLSFPF